MWDLFCTVFVHLSYPVPLYATVCRADGAVSLEGQLDGVEGHHGDRSLHLSVRRSLL